MYILRRQTSKIICLMSHLWSAVSRFEKAECLPVAVVSNNTCPRVLFSSLQEEYFSHTFVQIAGEMGWRREGINISDYINNYICHAGKHAEYLDVRAFSK